MILSNINFIEMYRRHIVSIIPHYSVRRCFPLSVLRSPFSALRFPFSVFRFQFLDKVQNGLVAFLVADVVEDVYGVLLKRGADEAGLLQYGRAVFGGNGFMGVFVVVEAEVEDALLASAVGEVGGDAALATDACKGAVVVHLDEGNVYLDAADGVVHFAHDLLHFAPVLILFVELGLGLRGDSSKEQYDED